MTYQQGDTEPNMPAVRLDDEIPAPPRFLLWGVIGLFILLIAGFLFGIFAFNTFLTSGQKTRVVNQLPWMDTFWIKQPTPQGGVLPTVESQEAGNSEALNLLNLSVSTQEPGVTEEVESTKAGMLVATSTPTPAPTFTPTLTPTSTPLPTSTPTAAPAPVGGGEDTTETMQSSTANLPIAHRNHGFVWARQTWNNCGPATITTALSYFGWGQDQEFAKSYLRTNREDKNVSPSELVNFVNERSQLNALWRMGGDLDLLRSLLAAGFPVVVERGMMFEANDWLGHYQALVAYDDTQGVFHVYDSFLGNGTAGEGETMRYADLDEDWRTFNRTFIVIYKPEDEATLRTILGDLWHEEGAAQIALETAQQDARANQNDGVAWHNIGTALVALGRYQEASSAFDLARQTRDLPWRILWYQFGMFEAYYNVGRYDDVISLAQSNLNKAPELEESYYWRGLALAAQGKTNEGISSLRTALHYNPYYSAAQEALDSLSG